LRFSARLLNLRGMSAKVFLDYDQAALDRQYQPRLWASNATEVIARYGSESEAVRQRIGPPLSFSYGASAAETLDVYRTEKPRAPVHVFVHGGAWRLLSKRESAFPAACFVAAGAHFVALDFDLLPAVDLAEMVRQVRSALAWLHRNAERFGGDAERLHLSGHSSGGHLAACALVTDWRRDFDLPPTIVKSGLCVSGIYDLHPVRLSSRNDYVKLDDAMENALSPIRHLRRIACPVAVAYGGDENGEFKRQSLALAAALGVAPAEGAGLNHFEILETLSEPDGFLARIALAQMGLG
jgi:arylformamidase